MGTKLPLMRIGEVLAMDFDYIEQGDCLELMKKIPDGCIDMILCDFPYGTTRNKWDRGFRPSASCNAKMNEEE